MPRRWRRHAARPVAELLGSGLHQLQPSQRDERYPYRSGLCRLHRERGVEHLEWGSGRDQVYIRGRIPVHAYVGQRGAGFVRPSQVELGTGSCCLVVARGYFPGAI